MPNTGGRLVIGPSSLVIPCSLVRHGSLPLPRTPPRSGSKEGEPPKPVAQCGTIFRARNREPGMSERADLHRAILAAPDDDAPRLVFADWLDEHGEPDQAEFIRLQCATDRLPPTSRRWQSLHDRAQRLLRAWRARCDRATTGPRGPRP